MNSQPRERTRMKDMPAEFFLPPQSNTAMWRETVKLVIGCVAYLLILGIVVALTQGIVISV
ncbi:hypothetical protein H7J71_23780 [Mycolicibacterium peregrinum]|uniref:DUF7156 family protein n=1 Tax=Mycolicibacterium TaxID=1866885 RepID=UPI000B1681A0|nr:MULTISPECIES: hypothetical protein [Mycolicibacterium]MCV7205033.1 hypothetical protein [Mycolicibacterium peregrinum]